MKNSVIEVKKLRKHNVEEAEYVTVFLSEIKTPIAYARKLKELMEQGAFNSEAEAKSWLNVTPFEMELYYSLDNGLFLIESEAVDADADLYNPYTSELLDDSIE